MMPIFLWKIAAAAAVVGFLTWALLDGYYYNADGSRPVNLGC